MTKGEETKLAVTDSSAVMHGTTTLASITLTLNRKMTGTENRKLMDLLSAQQGQRGTIITDMHVIVKTLFDNADLAQIAIRAVRDAVEAGL